MPWYSFTVVTPDGGTRGAGSTNLPDDDVARNYASFIVREIKQRGNYDPRSRLVVRNSEGEVHAIPF